MADENVSRETAPREPTVDDDGMSAEERAQFEEMRTADAAPPDSGAPPAGDTSAPPVDVAAPAVAAASPPDAEDDDEDVPTPAAQPGAPADPNAPKLPPRRVNYFRFIEAKNRAEKAEAEAQELRQTQARLDERLKLINEALQTPAQQPRAEEDPEPDPEADIFGHNKWLRRQMAKMGQTLQHMQEGQQVSAEDRQVYNLYATDVAMFKAREPNWEPAYQHLMQGRVVELAAYYFNKDLTEPGATLLPQEVQRIKRAVENEERQLATEALQNGQSPAQRIYQLARARGYRSGAAPNGQAAPQNGRAAASGNGRAAPAQNGNGAAPVAAQPSVIDEINRIKSGQEAGLSLSQGGGAPSAPMTAERLANMPQHEFEAFMEHTPPEVIKELLGG